MKAPKSGMAYAFPESTKSSTRARFLTDGPDMLQRPMKNESTEADVLESLNQLRIIDSMKACVRFNHVRVSGSGSHTALYEPRG